MVQLALNRQDTASFIPAAQTDALCPAVNVLAAALGRQSYGVVLSGIGGFIAPNNSTPLAIQLSGKAFCPTSSQPDVNEKLMQGCNTEMSTAAAHTQNPVATLIESLAAALNITLPAF